MPIFYYRTSHEKNAPWLSANITDFDQVKQDLAFHIGTTYLSAAPNKNPEHDSKIKHTGDFWIDIDKTNDVEGAIHATRQIQVVLINLGVDLNQVGLFASGGKGFHIRTPIKIMGGIGSSKLPQIFKKMAVRIDALAGGNTGIDLQLYNCGKGKLLRVENKPRVDGAFKVPMTWEALDTLTPEAYKILCSEPRNPIPLAEPTSTQGLVELCNKAFIELLTEDKQKATTPAVTSEMLDKLEGVKPPCISVIVSGIDQTKKKNAGNNDKAQSIALALDYGLATDDDIIDFTINNVSENNSTTDLKARVEGARNSNKDFDCKLMLSNTGVSSKVCKTCPIGILLNPPAEPVNLEILDDITPIGSLDLLKHVDDNHILKRLALEIATVTNIPKNTVFLIGLGITSTMAVRHRQVAYQHRGAIPTGLSIATEQPSGTGKSQCMETFQKPYQHIFQNRREGLLMALRSLDPKDKAGREAITEELSISFLVTDATPEALSATLPANYGLFGMASCEQALFNTVLGKSYGDGRANNNELLLKSFNGEYTHIIRISRDGYSGNVGGAVVLCAQEGSIDTLVTESNGTGLAERFLVLAEPNKIGTRDYLNVPAMTETVLEEYKKICERVAAKIFHEPKPLKDLPLLTISSEGWRLINEFRNKIEPLRADGNKYSHGSLRGATGKVDMQIMKIAANLQILESPQLEIDLNFVKSAIEIVSDLLDEHCNLLESKGFIGTKSEYTAVINYLTRAKRAGSVEIANALRGVVPFKTMTGSKAAVIKSTLKGMKNAGLLVEVEGKFSLM